MITSYLPEGEETGRDEIIELLGELKQHPIPLNSAGRATLRSFPLIDDHQVEAILKERRERGPFASWSDFIKRMHYDRDLWIVFLPYFTVEQKRAGQNTGSLRLRLDHNWETNGPAQRYQAPPVHAQLRGKYRITPGLRFGFLMERDAHEPVICDHRTGFLQMDLTRWQITFGQFGIRTGTGLTLCEPFGRGRGDHPVLSSGGSSLRIRGHTSSEENHYFNGLAIAYTNPCFQGFVFGSRHFRDGRPDQDNIVSSLSADGLHRTPAELNARKRVRETAMGAGLRWCHTRAHLGLTLYTSRYSHRFNPDPLRDHFGFSGRHIYVAGVDYGVLYGMLKVAGEITFPAGRTPGWTHQCILILPGWHVQLSWRILGPGFTHPHGFYLNERSPSNMTGFTAFLYVKPLHHLKICAVMDLCRRPWRTWFNPIPTSRSDLSLRADYRLSAAFELHCRYSLRKSDHFQSPNLLGIERLQKQRMEMRYRFNGRLNFRIRIENSLYSRSSTRIPRGTSSYAPSVRERGWLFLQNCQWKLHRHFRASMRWIAFSTDSYDSRIYQFEDNCPGILTCLPLYGRGYRFTLFFRFERAGILVTVKYGFTSRISSSGDGPDRLSKSYLTAQLDMKW